MVDSVGNAGGPQNLSQLNRTQNSKNAEEKRSGGVSEAAPQDEVSLSDEALAAQAEQTARETRTILEEQLEETLSSDKRSVDQLL